MRVSRRRCDDRSRGWNDEKKGPGAKKHMQPLTIENGMEIILHEAIQCETCRGDASCLANLSLMCGRKEKQWVAGGWVAPVGRFAVGKEIRLNGALKPNTRRMHARLVRME